MNDGTTVATVADMTDLIFDGNIDETEVGSLREGMPMLISVGALTGYSSSATLEYIAPKAVENNGPTSSRSRPPSRSTTTTRCVPATAPMQRSCCRR